VSAVIRTHCDAAIVAAQRLEPGRSKRLVLVTAILASSLDFIDGSVLNVALPSIAQGLAVDGGHLPWILNIYLLPLTALLLIGGAAGDRFGRRPLMIAGTAIFAVASIPCAIAPNLFWLLLGRAVQGIGAAMVLPNSLAILGATFSGDAKGRAIGIWAAAASVTAAAGPVIGGRLIDTFGWRSIFLMEIPIALVTLAFAWTLPNDRPEKVNAAPLDIGGAIFATAGIGALIWSLTISAGPSGWTRFSVAALCGGLAFLAVFIALEHRLADRAIMPLALFASKQFVGLTLLTLLLYGPMALLFLLVPYVLIGSAGYSAVAAGFAILPFPLVLAAVSPMVGKLAARIGERTPLTIGPIIVALGFQLLAWVIPGQSYWTTLFPAIVLIALGVACAAAPLTNAVLGAVDSRHAGAASGLNSAVSQLGGLIAIALLGGVLASEGDMLIANSSIAFAIAGIVAFGSGMSALTLLRGKRSS
jgi:EmrB/QacA subfamily drug resistance transporter